ncbi:hypothetical protein GCM10010331_49340 [Streptomyces xanthochromogenes]|uniref:hypothetical protein n=1 Tax=Streptomyces xanthochromogenes TaxID=67384 RepID=UPI00167982EA|nr:hypothetical protein [Streptomyces xanthochromogenes]GHB55632.1 hypothetical protein GCM10010331_49340 [Streptomyces xanthochromogenes]
MPDPTDRAEVRKLATAIDEALTAEWQAFARTSDPTVPSWADGPQIGTAPAVPQPGIPPMSQRSTDIGRTALFCSVATVPPGLIAIGLLLASGQADPTVIGWICAAPAALAVPILAVVRLLRGAKEVVEAAPAEIHHHYNGDVYQDQRNVQTRTSGLWAKTTNQQ